MSEFCKIWWTTKISTKYTNCFKIRMRTGAAGLNSNKVIDQDWCLQSFWWSMSLLLPQVSKYHFIPNTPVSWVHVFLSLETFWRTLSSILLLVGLVEFFLTVLWDIRDEFQTINSSVEERLCWLETEKHIFKNKNYITWPCYQLLFQRIIEHHLAGRGEVCVHCSKKVSCIGIFMLTE